ncbi:ABC-F family ATP-binding cassette domain-containing protein [Parvicella tangerina]|uniref:Probable ATP-binding protein YbiT n=1 Tax=Parvicella tangerina TaxID=2829795 RepID=A0A916JNT1_9FLAO|nr:ABC-F family ATP-binding cassette domain-containing protein [Parvicella tangerina]CAG5084364.1 putative ABC transporter ATP-binding protein YheS [Parvicella tangerina]
MISTTNLSLFFGGQELYSNISLSITKQDKIGLTGKNGAGKSTFLKLILGMYKPDEGSLSVAKGTKICYLPQEIISRSNEKIIDEVCNSNEDLTKISDRLDEINHQLATREDYESDSYLGLLDELADLNDKFNVQGGHGVREQAEVVLKGLGFSPEDLERPMGEFSGGWQMRVELAKLLVQNPDVLLLDEPTNHLDIESIEWLEDYLKKYSGAIILISHDRSFLDGITNRTIEINNRKFYDYNCNFSTYQVRREEEMVQQVQAYNNQQREIAQAERLINKFRAKSSKASFAQSLIKKLDKMNRIELDEVDSSAVAFRFPEPNPSGKLVAELEDVGKTYGEKEILSDVRFNIGKGEKIALIGKNGMGKSTFIKMLVGDTDYEGTIKLGHNVNIGYFAQDETAKLDPNMTVFETIDEVAVGEVRKNVRNILGSFLFSGDDTEKKVSVLSGGEKTRLALCKLLLEPYNFLILDEPTNHLDIVSKEVLQDALKEYSGTVLVVSHDRTFLDGLSDRIYYIKNKNISIYFDTVNDFLKQLKDDKFNTNARASSGKKNKSKAKEKVNHKEKRELENQLKKVERKIEKLEAEIADLQNKVAAGDYEGEEIFSNIEDLNEKLSANMQEWETVTEKLID